MGFDGEQRGEAWWARVRTPSLPICLTWLKNTLSTSWEISEMLCDIDKWLPLSGPWFPLIPEDISSPMKSALEFSTYPSAPLRGTLPTGRPHACKPPGPRPVTWLVGSGWGGRRRMWCPHPKLQPFVALWVVDPLWSNQFLKSIQNLDFWIKYPVFKILSTNKEKPITRKTQMAKPGSSSADGRPPGVETSFRDRLPLALESELGSGGTTCGRAPCLQWNLITPWHPHEMAGGRGRQRLG